MVIVLSYKYVVESIVCLNKEIELILYPFSTLQ